MTDPYYQDDYVTIYHSECLWMSPHCVIVDEQLAMFGGDQ